VHSKGSVVFGSEEYNNSMNSTIAIMSNVKLYVERNSIADWPFICIF
jgi:hypothetical protein